jgi:hypothetical protein
MMHHQDLTDRSTGVWKVDQPGSEIISISARAASILSGTAHAFEKEEGHVGIEP